MDNDLIPLSETGLDNSSLSEEEISALQLKLWRLLSRRTRAFTMDDSSSVRIETAQELFESICFTLRLHLTEIGTSPRLLLGSDAEGIFKEALKTIEHKIKKGRRLFDAAYLSLPDIKNLSLLDTVKGIGTFFKRYDYRFFAHSIPCSIDYQLCAAVPETYKGIEYINEYLKRLIMENNFIRRFNKDAVICLLSAYCPDYQGLLINLCDPVLTNALGLALVGSDIYRLNMTSAEKLRILKIFQALPGPDARALLIKTSQSLASQLEIRSADTKEYLAQTAAGLYPRIEAALSSQNLDGIFISW
jgi:hypothetical protein